MANLFFIHTPVQIMTAQMIIKQEGLKNNIMLQGFIGNNFHFVEIYNLIMVPQMWNKIESFPSTASWGDISRKHLWRDCCKVKKNYKYFIKLIAQYNIDTIYFGDMKNMSCILGAMAFNKRGIRVCFFEEGAGHYVMNESYGKPGNFMNKIYALIIDAIYYKPVFGVRFAHIIYDKGFTLSVLPIFHRYSVVPFYTEDFDIPLTTELVVSDKTKRIINEETKKVVSDKCRLLLTSPLYNNGVDENIEPFVETIINEVRNLDSSIPLLIKFHPREYPEAKKEVVDKLVENNIIFVELGKQFNIPVEFYLKELDVVEIIHFFCSTAFYNGYLFPKTKFTSILPQYYQCCKEHGMTYLQPIENLLLQLKKIK